MGTTPKQRRLILEAPSVVILHPDAPAGGFPMVAAVDRVADGLHWFLGSCSPLSRGEVVMVERPIQDDARYVTRGEIVAASPLTFALRLEPMWERVQQRAFVRITAHGLAVRVVRTLAPTLEETYTASPEDPLAADLPGLGGAQPDAIYDLLDISAGGIRFAGSPRYEVGEEVICHFELPGLPCFVLPGRIVRAAGEDHDPATKAGVGVEFVGLDEAHRSQLLRWVYREQVRRPRDAEAERTPTDVFKPES